MGVIDDIKQRGKADGGYTSLEEKRWKRYLNRMFNYTKEIELEKEFVKHVMTRGAETQERVGLHASALIEDDAHFCLRAQVLSLFYKQDQQKCDVSTLRIFEEGNAIHEKWQRLFIRSWFAEPTDCDRTRYFDQGGAILSYSPDVECHIPALHDEPMICEIKSMNEWNYKANPVHEKGQLQLQLYLHLTGLQKGFVLAENKNTNDFRVEIVNYNWNEVQPVMERMQSIDLWYGIHSNNGELPKRRKSKQCEKCHMRTACMKPKERMMIHG